MKLELRANNAQIDGALQRLAQAAVNTSPLMRQIAGIMHDEVEENFAQEGRPKWMGLSPKTLKRKKGDKILQESGQLASSIQQGAERTAAFVGSNKVYAAIQNNGGKIERAAYSTKVRHRTDAKGNLLRTEHFNGKGLIFAKDSHKRATTRWFEVGAHSFSLPARPFLVVTSGGENRILSAVSTYLSQAAR
jgi:phage virion morphogenesis protein